MAEDPSWGPLAVVAPDSGGGDALIHGTVHMTDTCVLLNEQGDDVLLLWPADRTSWDAEKRRVIFDEDANGSTTTIGNGDKVSLGGGGSSVDEGGVPSDTFMDSVEWAASPNPSCVTDVRWAVGSVVEVNGGE